MYLRLSYIFLNIFIFTCSCCYRSIKPIVDVQNEEKITKEISRSLKQSSEACFENETLKLYCYNNGKCLIKRVPFNITHQTVVLYCECKQVIISTKLTFLKRFIKKVNMFKGFGGVNCREDNRFLLADVNILFATFVCLVVSATIIYLVYRYKCGDLKEKYGNEAREKFLKNGK